MTIIIIITDLYSAFRSEDTEALGYEDDNYDNDDDDGSVHDKMVVVMLIHSY